MGKFCWIYNNDLILVPFYAVYLSSSRMLTEVNLVLLVCVTSPLLRGCGHVVMRLLHLNGKFNTPSVPIYMIQFPF